MQAQNIYNAGLRSSGMTTDTKEFVAQWYGSSSKHHSSKVVSVCKDKTGNRKL